ncbi:ABC transporter permease [Spirillospora sp. NPDC000708]|uniref:ABC transporter permease n=1 Tax=Actinomadura nitritigenes TaxID=134602 RepID=UPI00335A2659
MPQTDVRGREPRAESVPALSREAFDWRRFTSRYAIVGFWALMCALYAALMPGKFLQASTFHSVFASQQALVFLALAAMMTFVVGELDLSIASTMGLSATLVPVLAVLHHWSLPLACAAAVLCASLSGLVNGLLIVKVGVQALIVTLGSSTLLLGLASLASSQTTVSGLSVRFSDLALYEILGLPVSFYYGIALALAIGYVLTFTPLGRHMTFVGANREVARLAGVPVDAIRIGSFVAGSTLAGLGGVVLVASIGGFDPTSSGTYLLPAFAAVFLGTAAVRPGRFNPIGTLVAIYFLATGILGLQLLGYSGWIENVFYGTALVVAVSLATIVRRRTASN